MKKTKVIIPNNNAWMAAVNNMVKNGNLTAEQANEIYKKINNGRKRKKY